MNEYVPEGGGDRWNERCYVVWKGYSQPRREILLWVSKFKGGQWDVQGQPENVERVAQTEEVTCVAL